jgi:putative DNA primase/helicase
MSITSNCFSLLFAGRWPEVQREDGSSAYASQSEADLALCNLGTAAGGNADQLDKLFRLSGLYRPKWDERHSSDGQTYGQMTIAKALSGRDDGGRLFTSQVSDDAQRQQNGRAAHALPWSDQSNAEALVRLYGLDIRYCHLWKKWLEWNDKHWRLDDTGAVMRLAKDTIKRLAEDLKMVPDDKVKAFLQHIKSSFSAPHLKAMVSLAESEPTIPVLPRDLDADPWLLNCINGTLALQPGELRLHRRDDLLTKIISVAYNPEAQCPTWLMFLDQIMASNKELIGFLQKAIGYSLTGDVSEQVLFILWGTGANGKSTFLNTIMAMLGPYAMKATSELLMVSRNDRHPTERADLFSKRFVAAIETEEGQRLAEVFVKEATGGDPIRARRMREDFWEFLPTHKVFLATNHKPVIRGTDHAIWRRIRLIPFTVTIPDDEQDKGLFLKLREELPGILHWAVEGCLAWQREGLGIPGEVKAATEGYRTEMDVIGQFLEEHCILNPQIQARASTLYKVYKEWCEAAGEYAVNQRRFGMSLSERGFTRYTNNGVWWRGIGLSNYTTEGTEPTEPISGLNTHTTYTRGINRKKGSVRSVGSVSGDKNTDQSQQDNGVPI